MTSWQHECFYQISWQILKQLLQLSGGPINSHAAGMDENAIDLSNNAKVYMVQILYYE